VKGKLVLWVTLGLFLSGAVSLAMALPPAGAPARAPAKDRKKTASGSIIVYVRDVFGSPLAAPPSVSLASVPSGRPLALQPQHVADGWTFAGVRAGAEFTIHVSAAGYRAARQKVALPRPDDASAYAIFFLEPSDAGIDFRPPQESFILSPVAQKETRQAVRELASGHFGPAQKYLEKALRLAPENPLVNYLAGFCFLRENQLHKAETYLVKAVSLDPNRAPALLALGEVRYRRGDAAGAIGILDRAERLDPASWRTQWFLAASYLRERKYEQARQHAERVRAAGKGKNTRADLLLGEALGNGEQQKENPRHPEVARGSRGLKALPESAATEDSGGASAGIAPSPAPPVLPAPKLEADFWNPPDVDAERPFLIAGASCPLPEILKGAGEQAEKLAKDLQQFTATEDYESVEINHGGKLGKPFEQKFSYLVFLEQTSPNLIQSTEMRDQSLVLLPSQMGGPLMDTGSPVLAFAFHPIFARDFEWKCEGMGEWRGQPAWVIHFFQRPDRPISRLHGFSTLTAEYLLPLKGLAWVTANGNRVVRLETDLVKPLTPVELNREHFAIDYRPIAFRSHNVQLWLPEDVDTWVEYRGHSYHHYHHYSHFELFWVGAGPTVIKIHHQ
jgi:Tfp pilus assembly protein PilF